MNVLTDADPRFPADHGTDAGEQLRQDRHGIRFCFPAVEVNSVSEDAGKCLRGRRRGPTGQRVRREDWIFRQRSRRSLLCLESSQCGKGVAHAALLIRRSASRAATHSHTSSTSRSSSGGMQWHRDQADAVASTR